MGAMRYAIQLCFAKGSLSRLRRAYEVLDSPVTRRGDRPHLTLLVYGMPTPSVGVESLRQDGIADHVQGVKDILDMLAAQTLAFAVRLGAVGLFPGEEYVVYLAPTVTEGLLAMHRGMTTQLIARGLLAAPVAADARYLPGEWVPHVAVSLGSAEDRDRILGVCGGGGIFAQDVFGEHLIDAIEYIAVNPGALLYRVELQKGGERS